ncbi:putative oxysterol binding protein [Aulographum hederae CBS 113979]|uniref:Putative oxysterol binding protein n=1 Tax=Aulographum hederae CBS 113979 TaxID=1176131 RepID=A0A6G1HBT1_9PEZI|nr:putative oxysterol binding protein [Aulographum hederae CBS 113979]
MVLGHRRHSGASSSGARSSVDEARNDATDDETVVDENQGNVLTHIISQLRPGADLSRVTLPTFILEPRSMLERITNFMAHPDTLLPMPDIEDPIQRFVSVVKFYLSGWHIKPPGVKKPMNPIIGEIFTCYWDYPDKTQGYYIAEQTSHHPPKSSYFFMAPEHNIRIDGTLKPRSKFLGNSAASLMEGIAVMRFLNRGERYFVTQPNMYARGILFGKMKYELGDHSMVKCPESGLTADIEFKTKGYFGGTYNAIGGFIKDMKTDKNLFELSGLWNGEMFIKDLTTGKKTLLFDATHARETIPSARPLSEQGDRESQKLWDKTFAAIKAKDHDAATEEKSKVEDMQRQEAAKRAQEGVEWQPRLFRSTHDGRGGMGEGEENLDWIINSTIDGKTPDEVKEQIFAIAPILPGQKAHTEEQMDLPQDGQNLSKVPTESSTKTVKPATDPSGTTAGAASSKHPLQDSTDGSNDLIDFGQNDANALESVSNGTEQVPKSWQILEPTPSNKAQGAPVAPSKIIRQDSELGDVDEFVDAES